MRAYVARVQRLAPAYALTCRLAALGPHGAGFTVDAVARFICRRCRIRSDIIGVAVGPLRVDALGTRRAAAARPFRAKRRRMEHSQCAQTNRQMPRLRVRFDCGAYLKRPEVSSAGRSVQDVPMCPCAGPVRLSTPPIPPDRYRWGELRPGPADSAQAAARTHAHALQSDAQNSACEAQRLVLSASAQGLPANRHVRRMSHEPETHDRQGRRIGSRSPASIGRAPTSRPPSEPRSGLLARQFR